MRSAAATAWGSTGGAEAPAAPRASSVSNGGIRELFDAHFDFIWRSVRRLGLTEAEADDAAQQVFIVASRKLGAIAPGKERAFLFGIAVRVVSDVRKSAARKHEVAFPENEPAAGAATADVLIDEARARANLDAAILAMPMDLRTVFVLFELEELTMAQIAELLAIPPGTVASRIRRAREEFDRVMSALKARFGGGR